MRTSEIRTRWLDYFEKQGHEVCPSVSLVSPEPSILFTIAGMVPFIPYIMGVEPAPWPRATSVQKCIRTNDIDNVGKTTRHGTFFQMNGNFSFGDYFKEGAINFAWDLLTVRVTKGKYGLDGRPFLGDDLGSGRGGSRCPDEAGRHGSQAYCAPAAWWRLLGYGPARPRRPLCRVALRPWSRIRPRGCGRCRGSGRRRYLEVWNLVFDQFMRGEGTGKDYPLLGELDKKAIDTGAGLERLAFVMQDKPNMYEIDEVSPSLRPPCR